MKRIYAFFLLLLCTLVLCACGPVSGGLFGGKESPDVTDPIYSYDIEVHVYGPDRTDSPRYYDITFHPYDESYFISGVNSDMYILKAYYTEPNGKGTRLTDERGASLGKYAYDSDSRAYAYYKPINNE